MHVRPVDMPELRAEARRHIERHGTPFFRARSADLSVRAHTDQVPSAEQLASVEMERLADATLFHVTAPMVELAQVAGRSMPGFALAPEDIPARFGFMFFESPVVARDDSGGASYVAASWGPIVSGTSSPSKGVWVNWYFDVAASDQSFWEEIPKWFAKQEIGRLGLDLEMVLPFGEFQFAGAETESETYGVEPDLFRTLKTTWVLMAQPIATVSDAHYDRAARRQMKRAGREPEQVRVIALRRALGANGDGDTDREYRHRWIVRGHWRQQWYPSRGVNRPIWIAPHIKGPDAAPLLGGEKVYALKR